MELLHESLLGIAVLRNLRAAGPWLPRTRWRPGRHRTRGARTSTTSAGFGARWYPTTDAAQQAVARELAIGFARAAAAYDLALAREASVEFARHGASAGQRQPSRGSGAGRRHPSPRRGEARRVRRVGRDALQRAGVMHTVPLSNARRRLERSAMRASASAEAWYPNWSR